MCAQGSNTNRWLQSVTSHLRELLGRAKINEVQHLGVRVVQEVAPVGIGLREATAQRSICESDCVCLDLMKQHLSLCICIACVDEQVQLSFTAIHTLPATHTCMNRHVNSSPRVTRSNKAPTSSRTSCGCSHTCEWQRLKFTMNRVIKCSPQQVSSS